MANREIEAILKISAKMGNLRALNVLSRELRKVDQQVDRINRSQMLVTRASAGMAAGLTAGARMAGGFIAPAALTYGTTRAVRSYASIERQIERIGITADATAEETAQAMGRLRGVATELHMPFEEVVAGADAMVASGKSLDEMFALLPSVGKAAQASGAQLTDMAVTADAISNSLGITADQMERAFDILAHQGKAGKFELRDMAAELPSLAPAFAALGYRGEQGLNKLAAALQVVRMETGTSGEAATSFMDVLTKMESETVSNKFKNFGIDIRKSMAQARKEGRDLLETFVALSVEAVRGDLSKLPQLFTDKQMLIGMRALINNWEDFGKLVASGSAEAAGAVDRDFKRISKNVQASIDDMSNAWDGFVNSLGKGVAPFVAPALEGWSKDLDRQTAIQATLEEQGVTGFWAQQKHMLAKAAEFGFNRDRLREYEDFLARQSGWGGGDPLKARAQELMVRRQKMEAIYSLPPRVERDESGMPINPPIPAARPRTTAELSAGYRRYVSASPTIAPQRPFPAGRSPRDAERESMAALRRDPNGVADAIDEALAAGGERAGARIEEAARKVNEAGSEAGSAFARMLEGVAQQFGAAAARSFRDNIGSVTINAIGAPPSGNRGRSMPEAGNVVGPQ